MRLLRKSPTAAATPSRRQPITNSANQRSRANQSYHSLRLDHGNNTGRQKSREQRQVSSGNLMHYWLQRFGLLVLLVVSLVSLISALSLSANARIILLQTTGNSFLHDQNTYQNATNKILATSIWNLNKITINTADISQRLVKQFPELSSVSVVLPLLAHRPVVYLTPSQPALVIIGANGTFVLDTTGRALQSTDALASIANLKLPVLTDQSGLKLANDQRALSSSDVSFIMTVIAQLTAKQVAISSLTLPASSREIDAGISGQPYFVKFNLQNGDALHQAGTFLATKARLASQNITPAHYIDVRVPGRAYYQ